MAYIPRFTLTGAPPLVRTYGIVGTGTVEWDAYDCLNLDSARALDELGSAAEDILGAALGGAGNTTNRQSDVDEVRSYLESLTAGSHEPVAIMGPTTVFETDDFNSVGTAAAADVGERMDLELVSGDWGVNNGVNATGSTPQFAVIDIEDTRGTYFVVPDTILVAAVFQWFDAAV